MMMITSPENSSKIDTTSSQEPITPTTCSSWKLYENPFYNSQKHRQNHHDHHQYQSNTKHIHQFHLPAVSARKIAASFWDLTFFRPMMETELDIAQAQIMELKAELDYERKARKRAESMNKRLARELAEERRGRETMERLCEELARDISSDREEIDRIKREMEEERKMLRMAQVLREERVQMKLTEAKILFEEKLQELEESKRTQIDTSSTRTEKLRRNQEDKFPGFLTASHSLSGKFARLALSSEKSSIGACSNEIDSRESTRAVSSASNDTASIAIQRRAPSEPENPHIKRGIKGFVEFPRVVRATGSRSRHWDTKLECQNAQLRFLLKQRSPIRSNINLIMS